MDINNYPYKSKVEKKTLISLYDTSVYDIFEILRTAKQLKTMAQFGELKKVGAEKYSILITEDKLSKSRICFEMAAHSLNIQPITLTLRDKNVGDYLKNKDLIKVYERLPISSIFVDTPLLDDAKQIAKQVDIPVVFVSEDIGPCRTLCSLLTIWEQKGTLNNLKATLITDDVFFDKSQICGLSKCGIDVSVLTKGATNASSELFEYLKQYSNVEFTTDLQKSTAQSDVILCDNHNLGEDYKITASTLEKSKNALFLQNIPLERNVQAESGVYERENCKIYELGENYLHIIRSLLNLYSK